jgi:hypothetical protein
MEHPSMNRRTFLTLARRLAIGAAAPLAWPVQSAAAPIDRASKWQPDLRPTLAVEWRYIAGRITDGDSDFGFVATLSDAKYPTRTQELLVERQDFTGARAFVTKPYSGTLTYDSASATYSFIETHSQASASWQWDAAAQVYRLSIASPELSLQNVVLRPQGDLIPEGGDGTITVAPILGLPIGSDYHADWAAVEVGGAARGVARIDMQGLYLASAQAAARLGAAEASSDYDHHWFAVAGQIDGAPAWISAWRIEAQDGPRWDVTIARGAGTTWQVDSTTEQSGAAFPLRIWPLEWQALPVSAGPASAAQRTGSAWRLSAGLRQPGDLLDLQIAVLPGQFASTARLGLVQGLDWVEEAVGTSAAGSLLGKPLGGVALAVAETTAEFDLQRLPLVAS